jgi:hypothetical protein
MTREWAIGDTSYLKDPFLGYRFIEIIGHEHATGQLIVQLESGRKITVYPNEIE